MFRAYLPEVRGYTGGQDREWFGPGYYHQGGDGCRLMAKLNQSWSHSFLVKVRVIVHQNDKWLKAEKITEQYREKRRGKGRLPS